MDELEIPFARDPLGMLVRPDDVPRGAACNCFCPACGKPVLTHQGPVRRWHFAHLSQTTCQGGRETAVHLMAKQVIAQAASLSVPAIEAKSATGKPILQLKPPGLHPIQNPRTETRWLTFTPDLLLDGLAIEVTVTHPSEPEKLAAYRNHGLAALEIKLPLHTNLDPKPFTQLVLHSAPRTWLFHPLAAQAETRLARDAEERAARAQEAADSHLAHSLLDQFARTRQQNQTAQQTALNQHAQLLDFPPRPPPTAPQGRTCFHCGATTAYFGYGPPGWNPTIYACSSHRALAEQHRRST